ncbi:MAG: Transcriptional regulator SlyA [Burkholderia plantarii]|nr:MAG: Transcriptional regulator SlyA [Burkholderia plantarii]
MVLSRLYRRHLDAALKPYGLSEAVTLPMRYLARVQHPVRHGELAKALYLEGPTLVGMLDQLERAGFVSRVDSETDRRVKEVELTREGAEMNARLHQELAYIRLELFKGISDAQLEGCRDMFGQIEENLRHLDTQRRSGAALRGAKG